MSLLFCRFSELFLEDLSDFFFLQITWFYTSLSDVCVLSVTCPFKHERFLFMFHVFMSAPLTSAGGPWHSELQFKCWWAECAAMWSPLGCQLQRSAASTTVWARLKFSNNGWLIKNPTHFKKKRIKQREEHVRVTAFHSGSRGKQVTQMNSVL